MSKQQLLNILIASKVFSCEPSAPSPCIKLDQVTHQTSDCIEIADSPVHDQDAHVFSQIAQLNERPRLNLFAAKTDLKSSHFTFENTLQARE